MKSLLQSGLSVKTEQLRGMLCLVLLAGAGGHRGIHTRQADDLGSKIVPGADALTGAVIQAVLMGHAELQQLVGQVNRVGGVAALVVDNFQLAEFLFGCNIHGILYSCNIN